MHNVQNIQEREKVDDKDKSKLNFTTYICGWPSLPTIQPTNQPAKINTLRQPFSYEQKVS